MTAVVHPQSALTLPGDGTSIAVAAEMYAATLPLAPVPLYGLRPDGSCMCGRPGCVRSAGKHPIGDEWQKRLTRNVDEVRDRFRDHKGNIGLYLGTGRFVGIDADGDEGMATVAGWGLPPTLQAQSGSGRGGHFIFEYDSHQDPKEVTDRRVVAGVDVKTRGQFAAAPSLHKSGGVYRWVSTCPIAVLPDDIYARIRKERRTPRARISSPASSTSAELEKRARAYIARFEPAIEGSDGSRSTFAAARGLRGWVAKGLPESTAWNLLLEYNARCLPPWSERELEHKWADAGEAETIPEIEDRPRLVVHAGGRAAVRTPAEPSNVPESPDGSGSPPAPPGDDPDAWKMHLMWEEQRNGRPKLTTHIDNVARILQLDPRWRDVIRFDAFRSRITISNPPWDEYQRPVESLGAWNDEDTTRLCGWMRREFLGTTFSPTVSDCERAVAVVARTRDYNPVRDYLSALEWDGTARLSTWLATYLGASGGDDEHSNEEYLRLVGAWWLISAVARIYRPGCKVDTVPILEGRQGIRKSSALSVLFGAEFFNDTPIDIGSKDAYTAIQGCWCVELAELDSLMRAEPTRSKAFFSSGKDRFRRAYARHEREELRQCVFVGTTNGDEYLNDPTGGRRFWPIPCARVDIDALARDRDQLWAEAVHEYLEGRVWYPTSDVEQALLGERQEGRTKVDSWDERIRSFLETPTLVRVTTAYLLEHALKLDPKDWTKSAQIRVGDIVANRCHGWVRRRVTDGRVRIWAYERSNSPQTPGGT